jgi:hypothetical protein
MRLYSRWIFLVIVVIQVAWYCKDARDWCLWLPGLTICSAGLLADRRSYLCGNTLFWIVCLVLYVIAPASQLQNDYFQGPISVIGIQFSDTIIMNTVALADIFMSAALLVQLILRRNNAIIQPVRYHVGNSAASEGATTPLPAAAPDASDVLPENDGISDESVNSAEDNQDYVLVDDPGEFGHMLGVDDAVIEAPQQAVKVGKCLEEVTASASDAVSAILQSRVLAMVMLLISISVPVGMYFMVGSLDFVTNGRDYALSAISDNSALVSFIKSFTQDMLVVLCLLGIERYIARRSTHNLFLIAAVAGCMLIVINPFNTARYQVGAVLIMALLFIFRGRFPIALSYAGIALYMYALMPAMNLLRYGLAGIQGQKVAIGIDYNTLDYDCFSMFAFAVYRTGIDGFTYGKFTGSSMLFFLPRSLWPDKPKPSSSELGQYLMQHHSGWFDNLSCPPMGDGYMDFGIAGVLCMGALFGLILERSDQVIDRWSQMTFVRRGLAAAFIAFIPILLRGSLGAVIGFVIAPVVVLIILWLSAWLYCRTTINSTESRLAWEMRHLLRNY